MVDIRDIPTRSYSPEELLGPLSEVHRKNAPTLLFVAGNTDLLRNTVRVSVVGSRRPSSEGLARSARLARFLVSHEIVVVSGLAEGIDYVAHTTALEALGHTIAVLGTPLDRVYPPGHDDLQRRIMTEQLAVSQFPSETPASRGNFPQRNRTMALLSHASVIVEAGDSSGTLHQGWEALRLGRPLFLLKSIVDRADLKWPAEMLRYGAVAITDPEPILEFLPAPGGGGVAAAAF